MTEDGLAVVIATDAEVTLEVIGVVVLIALPFAVLSELVVDHPVPLLRAAAIKLERTTSASPSNEYHLTPRFIGTGVVNTLCRRNTIITAVTSVGTTSIPASNFANTSSGVIPGRTSTGGSSQKIQQKNFGSPESRRPSG
ncbi:hypothetical protein [Natronococcus wangiae]|uniref:hypothetical protein n=1 Tax=Natronococcus wangiae TaxID=3068275 RepID=UPI00273F543A|nr:hypothetical protein [Natronococcus sp. AD5]